MFESLNGLENALTDFSQLFKPLDGSAVEHQGPTPISMDDLNTFSPWGDDGQLLDTHPLFIGDPHGDGFTPQTTSFTCAVMSQKMILDQFGVVDHGTGQPLSEARLVYDATVNGWLSDTGTSIEDMGNLLEYYGVPAHHGSGFDQMLMELAQGHQVMVPVNADKLWSDHGHSTELLDLLRGSGPNHALVFKGVRLNDEGELVAVLNDPGQPHGAGVEYPVEQFRAALDDSGFHFVATDVAPPGWSSPTPLADIMARVPTQESGPMAQESWSSNYAPDSFAEYVAALPAGARNEFLKSI